MARGNRFAFEKFVMFAVCIMLAFGKTQGGLTLFIQRQFAVGEMSLSVNNDIVLISNGVVSEGLQNAELSGVIPDLPAKLSRIELTWFAAEYDEKYSLRITSSDLRRMESPVIFGIASRGNVTKVHETFRVDFPCTGQVDGEVNVEFTLNYTHSRTSGVIPRTLHFTITKTCEKTKSESEETAKKKKDEPVDRTIVVTVSAFIAFVVCVAVGSLFFWRFVKRIKKKFGFDELTERLSPRASSNSSSNVTIHTSSQVPTVVYSPKRYGSRTNVFDKIAKHEPQPYTTTTTNTSQPSPSHSCATEKNQTAAVTRASPSIGSNGYFSSCNSQDLKFLTTPVIVDDDVFESECSDVALLPKENSSAFSRDLYDAKKAFSVLNDYWTEKLGECLKSKEEVEIRSEVLGEGVFGRVLRGRLSCRVTCKTTEDVRTVDTAVKTCQEDIKLEQMVSFVNEAILMKRLSHENLLDLLGVVLQPSTAPLILTRYMAHGDLHKFLRHSRGISIRRQLIGSRQLVNFGTQIARGMEYLASHRVVHRDLAARNCLVDQDLTIRIGDFGLAIEVDESNMFKMEHPTQLAVKWLALESLLTYVFTEKTDVWSFGIVLWELVTLGSQPYAGLDNYEVIPFLETGNRLPRPLRCPDDLFAIMQSCWSGAPEDRPSFSVLVHKLEDYEMRLRPSCIAFEFDEDTIEMNDSCSF